MANDHLPEKQVLSSRGSSGHALQTIVLSMAYGAAFKYQVFESSVHSVQPPHFQ